MYPAFKFCVLQNVLPKTSEKPTIRRCGVVSSITVRVATVSVAVRFGAADGGVCACGTVVARAVGAGIGLANGIRTSAVVANGLRAACSGTVGRKATVNASLEKTQQRRKRRVFLVAITVRLYMVVC